MRKFEDDYFVFEINPRISSTMSFRLQMGFNDVAWWIDMMDKKNVEKYTVPNENIYGVRNVEEKLFVDDFRGGYNQQLIWNEVNAA
jgi:carbamoyl-phosphate synthase large subunit